MGIVINGRYYKDGEAHPTGDSPTFKQWHQNEQRKVNAKAIVQPYQNGKPNQDFINAYPEESKSYGFIPSDEQLKKM